MSLLFRLLQLIPEVRRLEAERDALRSEQNSMKLKVRATSAEMGVLDEQCRMLKKERDLLTQDVARRKTEQDSQAVRLKAAAAATEALTKERDNLLQERRALIAQNEAARGERDRISKAPDNRRQKTGPG